VLSKYKRWWIGAAVVIAICLLVWFVGPLIPGEPGVLETLGRRIALILTVFVIWLLIEATRIIFSRRRNRRMIQQLSVGGGDESLTREEAAQLGASFAKALETLKSTRLGGQDSGKLLYQMPWYMFIGAPGSGKTTALVNSGLRFPLAPAGASATALGGVGGTRNCDWWFTDSAVLIDTAGRYTTQDSNATVDQSAWTTFLGLLKKFRPRQPINGIFVTLSVSDLLTFNSDERQRYAQVVRQRVEELQKNLGLQFPVYVLVTKCDLIAGFNEFFSVFDAEQRAQVWGMTFDFDVKTRRPPNAREAFDLEFPALVAKINELLLARMQEERDAERRAGMYPFPQQFSAVAPLVSEFLQAAFGESRFNSEVLVRGVYFTSGTQQGAPIDRLLGSLSRSLSLRPGAQRREPIGAAKSFFITRLMKDVIFPEAGLAGHSEQRETRLRQLSWSLVAVTLLLSTALIAAWTASFLSNRSGLESAQKAVQGARSSLAGVGAPAAGDLGTLVEGLNAIRRVPPAFHDPVTQPPLLMKLGLYQGGKVDDQISERYRFALKQGLLPRIALQLEAIMASAQSKPEAIYAALKTYLMMYDMKHLDDGFFVGTVVELWQSTGVDREVAGAARDHLIELVKTRELQVARYHPLNEPLVAGARDRVAAASLTDRAYSLLRLSVGGLAKGLRLSEVVGPSGVAILERGSGVSLSEPIDYLFTREGYRTGVKPRIRELVTQLGKEEAWVMGSKASGVGKASTQELETAVLRRYFSDYQATWDGVLKDVKVRRIDSGSTALNVAQVLAQTDSPLKRLVVAVAEQTRLSGGGDAKPAAVTAAEDAAKRKLQEAAANATSGVFGSQAAQVVGSLGAGSDPFKAQEQALEEQFSSVRRLAGDGKGGEIDSAVALINEIFNELVALKQKQSSGQGVKEIPAAFGRARAQAERFGMPVSGAIKSLVDYAEQDASGGVRKEVKAGVGGAAAMCQRAMPGKYPFTRTSPQDAGVQDFVNVFKSGGDLDAFFNSNLAQYVDKSGGVWRLKATGDGAPPVSAGTLRQFQNADAIRSAFFNGGSAPSVTVDVSVVSGDAEVTLDYDGASHKFRVGSGSVRLTWPAKPGARLSLGGQQVVAADGPWALFRLLDKGTTDPSVTGDKVRVGYSISNGQRTVLELRTGSAAYNPFRLRELESFACPRE
jgi:type VI secretion system protein ImpL